MSTTATPEAASPPRPAFDARKYMRRITASGMPQAQADALVDLLNAALENVVTKDDIKHSLDGLEASVKSYADKLSKDDREFLITFTTTMVDQLRADMNARFDELGKRVDKVGEELVESRKENKEILKEIAASEIRARDREAEAEQRRQAREDAAQKHRQDREDAAQKHRENREDAAEQRREAREDAAEQRREAREDAAEQRREARDEKRDDKNRRFVVLLVGIVSAVVAVIGAVIAILEYLS